MQIICPNCGWGSDGLAHWRCECGYLWNTFETRGKCPKCSKQWADTSCPRCSIFSPHEAWYKSNGDIPQKRKIDLLQFKNKEELLSRKAKIKKKLVRYGVNGIDISYLPYLDFSEDEFRPAFETGCRILILWAVSYLSYNPGEKKEIETWLRSSALWERVSDYEKKLFTDKLPKKELEGFSWRIEAVIVLSWAVNLLAKLPELDSTITDEELGNLMGKFPIAKNPDTFLASLNYRSKEDIFAENIVNELITSYLRNKMLSNQKEELCFSPAVSFERHYALNWLRRFGGISEWDETDTST